MKYPNERLARSLKTPRPHGTRTRYDQGCRCFGCRRAKAFHQYKWRHGKLTGAPSNYIVPAENAQKYLLKLRDRGVGMLAIEEFSGVNKTILKKIRCGIQKHLRQATERKIFSVTPEAKIDSTKVPVKHARKMILELYDEGFTLLEIGKRIGLRNALQVPRKGNILAKTEMKIERFYNMQMTA